jgi:hypothetical protein
MTLRKRRFRVERDSLIDTGGDRLYFVLFTFLMTFAGILYMAGDLGAADNPTPELFYVEYSGLAIGGVIALGSFALRDKLFTLRGQVVGLGIQGVAAVALGATIFIQQGLVSGLFGIVFCFVVGFLHGDRLFQLAKEIRKVPVKRALAERVDIPASPDPMLSMLLFLEERTNDLETQLSTAISQFEAYQSRKK